MKRGADHARLSAAFRVLIVLGLSGLIYGFLTSGDPHQAVNYGAAHGALAMTTPGDTSMASLALISVLGSAGWAQPRYMRKGGNTCCIRLG